MKNIIELANELWRVNPNWQENFDYVALARDGSGCHWGYFDASVKENPEHFICFSRQDFYSLMLTLNKKYDNYPAIFKNHYDYIDWLLGQFYVYLKGSVVNKEYYSGLGQAHGDKCDQYRDYWESHGVPYWHGCVLYMLTFTSIMDRPKSESKNFVVDMYIQHRYWFINKDA